MLSLTHHANPLRPRFAALLAALALLGLGAASAGVASAQAPVCAKTGSETVWTGDSSYAMGSTADIHGSGYEPNCDVTVKVTWPDGSVQTGDGTATPGSDWVTTDSGGGFSYDYKLRDVGGDYTVEVLGQNGEVLATTVFADAVKLDDLFLDDTDPITNPTNYIFTAGNVIRAEGSVDNNKHYRWRIMNASGTNERLTNCVGPASGDVSDSYTVAADDPLSGNTSWRYELIQFDDALTCAAMTATPDLASPLGGSIAQKFFSVAKVNVYSDAALTNPTTVFSTGQTPFVTADGLGNVKTSGSNSAQQNWDITWYKPDGTIACQNTTQVDRPNSDATGHLPDPLDSENNGENYLKYPPHATATGALFNRAANYDGACPAFDPTNTGIWKLKVAYTFGNDVEHAVVLSFSVSSCVATSVTTNPTAVTTTYGDGNVQFTAAAGGVPSPSVAWEESTDGGGSWHSAPGTNNTVTYTVADPAVSQSGNQYRAVFTNTCSGTQTATSNPALLTVDPRPITVTADPQTKVYGDADPALTYAITSGSLAYTDTQAGVLSGSLTRVAGETVAGSPYAIQQGTLAANANYALTYVGDSLSITPRPITVTADPQSP
jgi:hypothetical protein